MKNLWYRFLWLVNQQAIINKVKGCFDFIRNTQFDYKAVVLFNRELQIIRNIIGASEWLKLIESIEKPVEKNIVGDMIAEIHKRAENE